MINLEIWLRKSLCFIRILKGCLSLVLRDLRKGGGTGTPGHKSQGLELGQFTHGKLAHPASASLRSAMQRRKPESLLAWGYAFHTLLSAEFLRQKNQLT